MYKDRKRINKNGYIVVEYPDHPKAFDTGTGIVGVYEHILIAEEQVLDRPIKEGEVVHHLNKDRSNNSPDNLLVLSGPMHAKLHAWLDKHVLIPSEEQNIRNRTGCVRCKVCEKPISYNAAYCSVEDKAEDERKFKITEKNILVDLVWQKPTTQLAKEYNVSDKTIEKLCKKLQIDKPPRGYWTKKKFEKI